MSVSLTHLNEKIYFDVVISNLQTIDKPPPPLYFNETRNIPFLFNPQEYLMSIIRFSVETPTLPVFICQIQPNQPDINLSIYSVSLSYNVLGGATYTQQTYVEFVPQNQAVKLPIPPNQTATTLQDNSTGYYYIYSYQYWIFLINQTFQTCYNGLAAQFAAAGGILPSVYTPAMSFSTSSPDAVAILNVAIDGYDSSKANSIKIYMNPAMYQLFSSFPVYIKSLSGNNQGLNVQLQTTTFGGFQAIDYPLYNNTTHTVIPDVPSVQCFQEYSTISLWTPVISVVFCSNTLPIVPTNLSTPVLINNGAIFTGNQGNNSNTAPVITDIIADAGIYKPNIVYNPSAQYRWVQLFGNTPLSNLDIVCYWKGRDGVLNPLLLSSGSTATLKILFAKKSSLGNIKGT